MSILHPVHLYFVFGNEAYSVYSGQFSVEYRLGFKIEDAIRSFSKQSPTRNLQPQPSVNAGVTLNLVFPVLKSQRFRVLHGHQGDLPLGGKVESSNAVLLMVRRHIPHMYASC